MKRLLLLLILVMSASLGVAQDGTALSGPVSGFVFDQGSHALRPVLGMPGASHLGAPVVDGLESAGVSPDGSAALAAKEGALLLAGGLRSGEASAVAIEGAIGGADRFAWAPNGASAAVYSSKSRLAQVLRDLATAPRAEEAIDLSALSGNVTALAFSGDALVVAVADEVAGGIYLVAAGAAPRMLAAAGRAEAIALAGRDLFFADRDRGQVWEIRDFAGDATPLLFAEGLEAPVGVQLTGKRLYVANAGNSTLEVFDLQSRAAAGRIALDAAPAALDGFGGRSLWLLNPAVSEGEPLYVLDGGETPAVYFVPAGRVE